MKSHRRELATQSHHGAFPRPPAEPCGRCAGAGDAVLLAASPLAMAVVARAENAMTLKFVPKPGFVNAFTNAPADNAAMMAAAAFAANGVSDPALPQNKPKGETR